MATIAEITQQALQQWRGDPFEGTARQVAQLGAEVARRARDNRLHNDSNRAFIREHRGAMSATIATWARDNGVTLPGPASDLPWGEVEYPEGGGEFQGQSGHIQGETDQSGTFSRGVFDAGGG